MSQPEGEAQVLDFDGWIGKQPSDIQEASVRSFGIVADERRSKVKRDYAAQNFISEQTGWLMGHVIDNWDTARKGYAKQKGGEWETALNDPDKFNSLVFQQATQQRDERFILDGPDDPKEAGAEAARSASLAAKAQEAAFSGQHWAEAYSEWQEANKAKPGYQQEHAAVYLEHAKANFERTAAVVERARPVAEQAFALMSDARVKEEGGDVAPFALFRGLTPDEKAVAFRLMADKAKGAGEGKGTDQAFFEAVGRAFENLAVGGGSGAWRSAMLGQPPFKAGDEVSEANAPDEVFSRTAFASGLMSDAAVTRQPHRESLALTAEQAAEWNEQLSDAVEDLDTEEQLRAFGQQVIDPTTGAGGWAFRKLALPVADSAAVLSSMAIPGAWPAALELGARSYQNEEYRRLRESGMGSREADALAGVTGLAQAALDKLEVGILANGIPGATRVLERFALGGSTAARFGANFTGTLLAETGIELVQDHLIPALVQDNLAADGNFDVRWGEVWEKIAETGVDTALGMVLLAGAGGAAQTAQQTTAALEFANSPAAMAARGYSDEEIATVQTLPDEAKGHFLGVNLPAKAPEGAELDATVARVNAHMAKEKSVFEAKQAAETATAAEVADYALRVTKAASGWWVTYSDKTISVNSAEAAVRIRDDLKITVTQRELERLIAEMEAWSAKKGAEGAVSVTGDTAVATTEIDPVTGKPNTVILRENEMSEADKALGVRVQEMTPGGLANLHRQSAAVGALDGNGRIEAQINGSNVTEFADILAGDARRVIQLLEINRSPLGPLETFWHESVESEYRKGLLLGTITEQETARAVASVADAFPITEGLEPFERAVREMIQRVARGEGSSVDIQEAHSEIAVRDILGRGKDGSKFAQPGSITAALDAAARRATDRAEIKAIGTLKAFIRAMRTKLRALFGTIVALRKKRKAGEATDWEAHINKVLGLDEQAKVDKGSLEEAEAIAGEAGFEYVEPSAQEQESGIAFSLSFGDRIVEMQRQIEMQLDRDPELRTRIAKAVKRRLAAVADSKEIVEKRTPKELDREEFMRGRLRYRELLNEGMAALPPETLHAYYAGRVKLEDNPLVAELLANGRLISQTENERRGRTGEYDDKVWLPPSWYGGSISPDQAAQILFDAHLLRDAMPGTFWKEIGEIVASAKRSQGEFDAASNAVKDIEFRAKRDAKAEAEAWRKERDEMQGEQWSARASLVRDIRAYNAVISVFPSDVFKQVGGWAKIASLGSEAGRLTEIKKRIAKADELLERYLRKQYDGQLKKLFARAEPKQDAPGKKPRGKAGADVHALFDVLRAAVAWSSDEADAHISKLEAEIAGGELSPEQEAHKRQEAALVALFSDWKHADAARRETAINEGTRVFVSGYAEFQFKAAAVAAQRKAARGTVTRETGKSGTDPERDARAIKDAGWGGSMRQWRIDLASFEQVVHYIQGPESILAQRFSDRKRWADNQTQDEIYAAQKATDDLFNRLAGGPVKGARLRWQMAQKTIEIQGRQLSEAEAIDALLTWRQPDGQRNMIGNLDEDGKPASAWHYDQAWVDELEGKLSKKAKAVMAFLAAESAAEYAVLNPVFREVNGIDLPQNPNYWPLSSTPQQVKQGQVLDPITGQATSIGASTPGSLRTRTHKVSHPEFMDALNKRSAHIEQMAHWKAHAMLADDLRAVFNNREVGFAIEAGEGKETLRVIRDWVDRIAMGGTRNAAAHLAINKQVKKWAGRAASAMLAGRFSVLAVQSTQLGAALSEMPSHEYAKRLAMLTSGQLSYGEALKSKYIQRRLAQLPPIARMTTDLMKSEKPNVVKFGAQKMGEAIGGADALFTAGTYAMVYDYQLGQAKEMEIENAEEVARDAAERITDRIAQPIREGTRSILELNETSPYWKIAYAFMSEGRKSLAITLYAQSKRPLAQKLRTLTYVVLLNSGLAAILRNAVRDALRPDEDDEVFDEKSWNWKRLGIAIATEPLQAFPVAGNIAQNSIMRLLGEYSGGGDLLSVTERGIASIKHLPDIVTGERDMEKSLKDLDLILSAMSPFNDTISAAASFTHLAKDLYGGAKNLSE